MSKRVLLFWITGFFLYLAWYQYMVWKYPDAFKPPVPKKKVEAVAKVGADKTGTVEGGPKADAASPDQSVPSADSTTKATTPSDPSKVPSATAAEPTRLVTLGEDGNLAPTDFYGYARLSSEGAAVTFFQANPFRAETADRRMVLIPEPIRWKNAQSNGWISEPAYLLSLTGDSSLATKSWKVIKADTTEVIFETTALDGKLKVTKKYSLQKMDRLVKLTLGFTNLTDQPLPDVEYKLHTPSGLPVEGKWWTSQFNATVFGLQRVADGYTSFSQQTVYDVVRRFDSNPVSPAMVVYANAANPVRFAGVASQYFAALVIQEPATNEDVYVAAAESRCVYRDPLRKELSNIDVVMTSVPRTIAGGQTLEHVYQLYNGPKSDRILAEYPQYGISTTFYYSWFMGILPVDWICILMVTLVEFFNGIVHDYGVAIILLTVAVRLVLFPLSWKQTKAMHEMQELAPKIEEMKKKYGDDKEKLNKAMWDLYAKHNVNPFMGCLPILLQMPIFVGLWQGISGSFELRQAPMFYGWTWVKDLAAPDQLFPFGFDFPFLGPYFNLLPTLAAVQMLLQMHYMTPKATTPEMELNQKMMKYMMGFMAIMFFRVPAGLCLYIITSTMWSLLERQLLPKKQQQKPNPENVVIDTKVSWQPSPTDTNGTNAPSWKTTVKDKKKNRR